MAFKLSRGGLDWAGVARSPDSTQEDHHIFPRDWLGNNRDETEDKQIWISLRDSVLNRIFVSKAANTAASAQTPPNYLNKLTADERRIIQVPESFLGPLEIPIKSEAFSAFLRDRYDLIKSDLIEFVRHNLLVQGSRRDRVLVNEILRISKTLVGASLTVIIRAGSMPAIDSKFPNSKQPAIIDTRYEPEPLRSSFIEISTDQEAGRVGVHTSEERGSCYASETSWSGRWAGSAASMKTWQKAPCKGSSAAPLTGTSNGLATMIGSD